MPKIKFQGKTYNSELEMPYDIRQAYNQEKNKAESKPLTDIVDMSPQVKAIYERALGKVEDNLPTRPSKDLPRTEDIYRQSAPKDMKDLPSDESIYRPSQPLIDPAAKPTIEPDSGFVSRRLITSLVLALILVALVFLMIRFFF